MVYATVQRYMGDYLIMGVYIWDGSAYNNENYCIENSWSMLDVEQVSET